MPSTRRKDHWVQRTSIIITWPLLPPPLQQRA